MHTASRIFRRAAAIRGTTVIVTLTLAFVLPYLFYYGLVVYNNVKTDHRLDFKTDLAVRSGSALIAFSNSARNVMIYIMQMRYFRLYLKKKFRPGCLAKGKNF